MKYLVTLLILFFLGLQFKLWLSDDGYRETQRLREAVAEQEAKNRELKQRNRALEAEVKDLKEGLAAIEERARSELGMVKQGETFYQIIERDAASSP